MNKKSSSFRSEKDSMGEVKVPKEAYYGAFTVRAKENFQISKYSAPASFRRALGIVKMAAAKSNGQLGVFEKEKSQAIVKAAEEFIDGRFDDQFLLDVFQAGAGTSYNMNANEIIANRANELYLEKKNPKKKYQKGSYQEIHPNNHVNYGQSTNDVIPTATRISAILEIYNLILEILELENTLEKIAEENKKLLKVGRTHLQDAVPITLGQEFDSYKQALVNSRNFILERAESLKILGIGGTAVGTGINSHPKYQKEILKNLEKIIVKELSKNKKFTNLKKFINLKLQSGKNLTEMANNMNALMNFHGSLRSLATNILNLCSDLKLMNMGPKAGLAEISLPAVQPGSSIMPGKINPSIPEAVEMVCFQVLGNDQTISLAASRSHFELNVFCPIIMHNLLESLEILSNGLKTLRKFSLEGLKINKDKITKDYENSLCTATALAPILGYQKTSDIVKNALKNKRTIKEEILSQKLMSEKELAKHLSVEATTKPRIIK